MKIDSSVSDPRLIERPQALVAPLKPAADTEKTAEKADKYSASGRITKWFAQAGVSLAYGTRPRASQDDKIALKKRLLEQRKINNLEKILSKALDFCLEENHSDDIDADWFFSFINMAENIHSPAMQELWGKIFAVESSKPGSFSLRTLQLLQQLTQKDALIFRQAVNLASRRKGDVNPKIVVGYYRQKTLWSFFSGKYNQPLNLAHFGLSYPDLLALMDLGLIHHSEIESGELNAGESQEWRIAGYSLTFSPKVKGLTLVYFKFTTVGAELSKLVNSQKQDVYVSALRRLLQHAFEIA